MAAAPDLSTPTDEELAATVVLRQQSACAWRAAQEACRLLYQRHARRLLAFLAARVRASDVEDVHQAVWARVWEALPGGFRGGSFRAWLYQVARNYVIDLGRKKRPEAIQDEGDLPDHRLRRPEAALIEAERMEALRHCLEKLGGPSAELVRARLTGEGYETICRRLDIKAERAHKLFHLAKEQLQRCVERSVP